MDRTSNQARKIALAAGIATLLLTVVWEAINDTPAGKAAAASATPSAAAGTSVKADGEAVYMQYCIGCHAIDGHGSGTYPDIAGDKFRKRFGSSFDKTYAFVSSNMPDNDPGSLSDEQYRAVVAYVQSLGGIATDFGDIQGHFAEQDIQWLWDRKYIDGYSEGDQLLYKPNQPITRGEFVRYLVKAKELLVTDNPGGAGLTDIGKSKDSVYIATAVDNGWINGYGDRTFRPGRTITRAEIAAVLVRCEGLDGTAGASAGFGDVPSGHWASGVIAATAKAGLFGGYEDGTFHPGGSITRGEAAAVLFRLVNPNP